MKQKHLNDSPIRKDVNGGNPLWARCKEAENPFRKKQTKSIPVTVDN